MWFQYTPSNLDLIPGCIDSKTKLRGHSRDSLKRSNLLTQVNYSENCTSWFLKGQSLNTIELQWELNYWDSERIVSWHRMLSNIGELKDRFHCKWPPYLDVSASITSTISCLGGCTTDGLRMLRLLAIRPLFCVFCVGCVAVTRSTASVITRMLLVKMFCWMFCCRVSFNFWNSKDKNWTDV